MPQSAANSSSPADSNQPPALARQTDPAARDRPPESEERRLAEDIEMDRKVLERLRADYELHAGRVAELETQIEALKRQGNQLVKRLQTGRKTVGVQSQIISRLQERIAAAERRHAGVEPPCAESDAAKAAPTSNGGDALKQTIRELRTAVPSTAVPRVALPNVAAPRRPAGRPEATSAGGGDLIADNLLMGQLLEYQARQRRRGRPRRILLSLGLIAMVVAALLGLGLLLAEMFGLDLWRLGRTEATLDRAGQSVSGASP